MAESVSKAKATLLRALEQLEKAEGDLDAEPARVDLVVVYSVGYEHNGGGSWHEVAGWASTAGPKWLHAALLRRAATSLDAAGVAIDDEPDTDGPDDGA
jgi:hypothetical protein